MKLFTVFFSFNLTVVIVGLDDAFRLEGSGYDERENIQNILKDQSLFDVHRQYLQTFVIDLQTEVSKVSLLCLFSQNLARLQSVFIFISYPLVVILHL